MEVGLGFSCRPIQAFWGDSEGTCIDLVAFTYFNNITNLVTDLWIFALPIPLILGLHTSRDKRIGLCFLFSVGLGTCAISAARLSVVFGVGSVDYTCKHRSLSYPLGMQLTGSLCRERGFPWYLICLGTLRWHIVCQSPDYLQALGTGDQEPESPVGSDEP